ncbi:MAG TPA: glycosyltransferase family protein [Nitrosopumilaceae archaeon]|nr:glycosyltransferase family protein [Nitrosopumilaceae archaeon]
MQKDAIAIIQARMNSTRLPGKVLRKIGNKPMLHYVINQVRGSRLIEDIIIVTTTMSQDDVIVKYCKKNNIKCFRGSSTDLLDRYYKCAKKFGIDTIVRITSDCPLIDPRVVDRAISKFLKSSFDYVANNLEKHNGKWDNSPCNFPQGMTVEVSSFNVLEYAWKKAKKPSEREHVFPYVQFNPKLFRVSNFKYPRDLSFIRCTVDRLDDLKFVTELYKRFPKNKKFIEIKDIVKIVRKEPDLVKMNNRIAFDEGYKKSLKKDRKIGFR